MISIIFGESPYQSTWRFSAVLRSRDETKYVSETVKPVLAENVTILSLIDWYICLKYSQSGREQEKSKVVVYVSNQKWVFSQTSGK